MTQSFCLYIKDTQNVTFYVRAENCIPGQFTGVDRKLSAIGFKQIRLLGIDDKITP